MLRQRQRQREMFVPLRHDPRACAGRLRRSAGGDRRGGTEDPLLRDGPAALATPASCRPIRRRRRRRSAPGTSRRSPSSAGCRSRSCTTTPGSRWRGFWGMARRQRTRVFSELQSHYLFADRFGRPGKGNDKGKVEGLVGLSGGTSWCRCRMPPASTALNEHLLTACRRRLDDRLRGHDETIGERLARDLAALPRLCRRRPTTPARSRPAGSARCRWCAIAAPTTRCRPPTAIARFWSAATSTRW